MILSNHEKNGGQKKLNSNPEQKLNCSVSAGFYAEVMEGPIFCCLYRTDAIASTGKIELHLRMRTDIRDMSRLPQHGIPDNVGWKLDTVAGPFSNKHNAFLFLARWSRGQMSLIMRRMTAVALVKNRPTIIVWHDGPVNLPPLPKPVAIPKINIRGSLTSPPGYSKESTIPSPSQPTMTMMSDKEFFFGTETIPTIPIPGLLPPQKTLPLHVPAASISQINNTPVPMEIMSTVPTNSIPSQPLFLGRSGGFSSWGKSIEQM